MEITTIGIDLAKSVFAVSGADRRGKVVMRRQLRRAQVLEFMGKLGPCVVGMEACGGASLGAGDRLSRGDGYRPPTSSFPSRPSAGAVIKRAREGKLLLATKRA